MHTEDWALCVGIGDYLAETRLGTLPGARADAERFLRWLVSDTGGCVPREQCTLIQSPILQSETDPQPVAKVVEAWFRLLFRRTRAAEVEGRGSRIGRRLYLYFSGHGISLGDTRESVLLTADAEPPAACEHFAARLWAEWFRVRGAFDEVLLIMDCCRSGVRSVHVNGPPWQVRHGEPARHFYAFAVADGAAAREIEVEGKPVGLFTHALLEILDDASQRPLCASTLKGLLYGALDGPNEPSIEMPANPRHDFVVASAPAATAREHHRDTLVVYDDGDDGSRVATSVRLAGGLAVALGELRFARDHGVRDLIIESERASDDDLACVLGFVRPQRAVLYRQRAASAIVGVRYVCARAADSPALAMARVVGALDGAATATLRVYASEPWTRILVWTTGGELLAEGSGRVELEGVPRATYRVRARIGTTTWTVDHALDGDAVIEVPRLALATAAPVNGSTRWTEHERAALATAARSAVMVIHRGVGAVHVRAPDDRGLAATSAPAGSWTVLGFDSTARRAVLEVTVDARRFALSLPVRSGYRTEVYVDGGVERPDVAIRVVRSELAAGAPHSADRLRESLRLVLSHEGASQLPAEPSDVGDDPIAALLASASPQLSDAAVRDLIDRAAIVLGDTDEDVVAGRGGTAIADPPLLTSSWNRLTARRADVVEASLADHVSGRQLALSPWLAWDREATAGDRSWLRSVAAVMWPAWDTEPALAEPAVSLDAVGRALGVPDGSASRRTKKAPPVERLVRHDELAFVGASNDQLAAAIAIAFVERAKRRWRSLTLWSLDDSRLDRMVSAARSGASLRRARDRAQAELIRILPIVADDWRVLRYAGFDIGGVWHFASLWDWHRPGGFVHVSPYVAGQDVRTGEKLDATWPEAAAAPPAAYATAVRAYAALVPTAIITASR